MAKEVEVKFKLESTSFLRKKLRKLNAEFISKNLEKDIYYCISHVNPKISVIRLRRIGARGIFTVKEYVPGKKSQIYKIREEHEVEISDSKVFSDILCLLGFKPAFRKEKIRETYTYKGAKILLDKLPLIGFYLEIEGKKERIKNIVKELGLNLNKALCSTYMDIFNDYKKKHNINKRELIFSRCAKK